MSDLRPAIRFASGLYRQRAGVMFAGYVRRDPIARLTLRPGRASPYAIYDRMRASGPLLPTRLGGLSTTSYRVCSSVLRDRRFGARPAPEDQADEELFDLSFLGQNPPDHTRLRRLAQPAFSPRAIAGYAGRIESTVGELLAQAAAAGEFDLISAFAAALPIAVITDMLGIPDADADAFSRYGAVIGSALDGIRSLRHAAQLQESDAALTRLFQELFELRRREPQDDVVSRIVAAEGSQIEPAEMLPMCSLLLVAGFETRSTSSATPSWPCWATPRSGRRCAPTRPAWPPARWRRPCAGTRRSRPPPGPRWSRWTWRARPSARARSCSR